MADDFLSQLIGQPQEPFLASLLGSEDSPTFRDMLGQPQPIAKPQNWQEKRYNQLGVFMNPDAWTYLEHPTHSDWYQKGAIQKFAEAATRHGVDPYDFVALGISESGLGNQWPSNPTRIMLDKHGSELTRLYGMEDPSKQLGGADMLTDYGARYMRDMMRKYPNRPDYLQAYSGTGRTFYGGNPGANSKWFGKPLGTINAWQDKPQAKRIMDISERLKTHPEIPDLISTIQDMMQYY